MLYNRGVETKEYLLDWYGKWEPPDLERKSISAAARYLGFNQSTFAQWIAGNGRPSKENCRRMAPVVGDGIFIAAGYSEPEDPFPERLRLALESARDTIISRGLVGDSPEAEKVIIDAMSAAGYRLIVTKDDPSTN